MPPDTKSTDGLAIIASLVGQNTGALGAMAGDLLGMKTTGALFVAVMRSRTVEDRIVQQFDLKKVYWKRLEKSARERLEDNTAISEDRKSGVITLTVEDHDADRAARIARAYIDSLDVLMAQLNTSAAHRERVFLEGRLNSVKLDLESAEKNFSQFASRNATFDISTQGKAMLESAARLQGELIAAESQLEGLRQIYTDNNVRVRSIQARIKELRSQQSKMGGKYDPTDSGKDLTSNDSYPTLRQLPILGVPYADKFRELKVEEAVFETLTKQYELAKVQEAKEIPSVKVLDAPEIPEKRSWPPRTLIIVGGTLAALLLASLWILGTARLSQMDPRNPGLLFAQEVFGTARASVPWSFVKVSRNGEHPDGSSEDGNKTPHP
jgi:capsule polysaccharide export protein KpsE/RkpR